MAACTDEFEEINTNQNVPLSVTPNLLLPAIIFDAVNSVEGNSWGIGNIVIQHTAKIQFVNEDRYLWGEFNGIWNTMYTKLRDVNNLENIAIANNQKNYEGVALILRSWMFSLLTDCYGDIPYTQATRAKEDGTFFPVYDPQEVVYDGILADLKRANEILGTSTEQIGGDILFAGDVMKWKKMANSLRLRYLMRISNRRDVAAQMAEILNNPGQNPIFQGNADNAALRYLANFPNQFPRHLSRVGSFDEFRVSKTLVDKLLALNDPRLTIFARPTNATAGSANPQFVGVPNGLNDVDALAFNGGSNFVSRIGSLFFEDAITPKGLDVARGVIMNYSELQFILAEAAQRGLIQGDVETFYKNGIQGSFGFYGLAIPDGYLDQADVALNNTDVLKKIADQKWISLFYQGMEAWFDWRRSGLPALTPGRDNLNNDRIPVRFIYPTIEQALNGTNRNQAVARQGEDNINTRVWWNRQ